MKELVLYFELPLDGCMIWFIPELVRDALASHLDKLARSFGKPLDGNKYKVSSWVRARIQHLHFIVQLADNNDIVPFLAAEIRKRIRQGDLTVFNEQRLLRSPTSLVKQCLHDDKG